MSDIQCISDLGAGKRQFWDAQFRTQASQQAAREDHSKPRAFAVLN
jgi:hypothetical protein